MMTTDDGMREIATGIALTITIVDGPDAGRRLTIAEMPSAAAEDWARQAIASFVTDPQRGG